MNNIMGDNFEVNVRGVNYECKHPDAMPYKKMPDTSVCFTCNYPLVANEIEVNGEFHEIGRFCDTESCGRYLLLVV